MIKLFRLNPDYGKRVFGLDLMRAFAIIFVVMGHGSWMLDKADTDFPWIGFIDGVELFFVLSGFLIGGILIKLFQNTKSLGVKTLWNFWIRRWFRTLPNYYLILLIKEHYIVNLSKSMSYIVKSYISIRVNIKYIFYLMQITHDYFAFKD